MTRKTRIDWTTTRKVREAVRDCLVIVPDHFLSRASECYLDLGDVYHILESGVVLPRRVKDELGTAVDGYKHFLEGMTPAGRLFEIVFKFLRSEKGGRTELVILLTVYRGGA